MMFRQGTIRGVHNSILGLATHVPSPSSVQRKVPSLDIRVSSATVFINYEAITPRTKSFRDDANAEARTLTVQCPSNADQTPR